MTEERERERERERAMTRNRSGLSSMPMESALQLQRTITKGSNTQWPCSTRHRSVFKTASAFYESLRVWTVDASRRWFLSVSLFAVRWAYTPTGATHRRANRSITYSQDLTLIATHIVIVYSGWPKISETTVRTIVPIRLKQLLFYSQSVH